MVFGLLASLIGGLFGWSMALLSLFLILLVLVQRGRGGGLTGALGGPGGQSAFGSKAGDMFTRITFIVAGVWILLCALAMWSLGNARSVVAVPPEGVVGETNEFGGGVAPPTTVPDAATPAGALPDLSGLGDLSELSQPPANPANPDSEAPAETPAESPATEAPATEAPVTEAPVTEAPVTEAPLTEAPLTEAPLTEAPVTEVPATESPLEDSAPATE